jgi:hypothetical protein
MHLLRFKLAQMCYCISTKITRQPSYFFLLFNVFIYYIIDIKSAHKTLYENSHMRYMMTIRTHIEIHILNH